MAEPVSDSTPTGAVRLYPASSFVTLTTLCGFTSSVSESSSVGFLSGLVGFLFDFCGVLSSSYVVVCVMCVVCVICVVCVVCVLCSMCSIYCQCQ